MAAEPAFLADARLVDAIARRVVELLEGGHARAGGSCRRRSGKRPLDGVAGGRALRVSRSWVYAHQRELGAMRPGSGHGRGFGSMRQWWPRHHRFRSIPDTGEGVR